MPSLWSGLTMTRQARRPHQPAKTGPETRPKPDRPQARWLALRVLADMRPGRRTARQSAEEAIGAAGPDTRETALTIELVMGVLRHKLALVKLLEPLVPRGWSRINHRLQHILLLGAYQLIFLDGIPSYAAVNEAVEQAAAEAGPGAARFVNALLRNLQRSIENPRAPLDPATATRILPIDAAIGCLFRRPILPDPVMDPIGYLSMATSHPAELVHRWTETFGLEPTHRICWSGIGRPPVILRPNPLRVTPQELIGRLAEEGIEAVISACGKAVCVPHAGGIHQSTAFRQGLFQAQDPTAMQPVLHMDLQPGQVVLDLCAGLGTKATQMAEIMGDRGTVIATDRDEEKLARLTENARRLGLTSIRCVRLDRLEAELPPGEQLDWILLDVPCSNTGVLARRPEVRYRFSGPGLGRLVRLQRDLLELADRLARTHTRLMYATCSLEAEENGENCSWFVRRKPAWHVTSQCLMLPEPPAEPQHWRDGGFWARFEPSP